MKKLEDQDKMRMNDAVEELTSFLKKSDTIAFVGAGISKPVGYPLLSELINTIKELGKLHKYIRLDLLKDRGQLELLRIIKLNAGDAYYDKLYETFAPKKNHLFHSNHLQVLGLPVKRILTTNYDPCLENAYVKLFNKLPCYCSWHERHKLDRHKREPKAIFHLHGFYDEPRSIILAEDDYQRLYNSGDYTYFIEWLKSTFMENSVVFIGFSLEDLAIMNFPKWVRGLFGTGEVIHCALLPEYGDINSEMQRSNSLIAEYRLKPIWFPNPNLDFKYLNTILKKVAGKFAQ